MSEISQSSQSVEPTPHEPYVPDRRRPARVHLAGRARGGRAGDRLRRLVALPGAQGGHDRLGLDSRGRAVDHAVPRLFSRMFGIRRATILENNIVQTTGSAGESIAFGVGVTMPALMLLGFEMEVGRVMVVAVLGGAAGHPDDDPACGGRSSSSSTAR